jgi:hypothetical protein
MVVFAFHLTCCIKVNYLPMLRKFLIWDSKIVRVVIFFSMSTFYTNNLSPQIFSYLSKYRVESEKSKHWSVDDNYDDTTEKVFPMRVTSVRKMFYFRFGTHKDDIDYNCDAKQGFKIILHHPAEIPTVLTRYILAAHHQPLDKTCRINDFFKAEGLRSSNERSLKYYKIYTQRNCEIECLANYTLNKCGCVSFYMPRMFFQRR